MSLLRWLKSWRLVRVRKYEPTDAITETGWFGEYYAKHYGDNPESVRCHS